MKNKSMEFWYGAISVIGFIAAIISRPELSVSDKILTISLISAIPWAISFVSRKAKETEDREEADRNKNSLKNAL